MGFISQNASVTLRAPSALCATPVEVSVSVAPTWSVGIVTDVPLPRSSLDRVAAEVRIRSHEEEDASMSESVVLDVFKLFKLSLFVVNTFPVLLFQLVPATHRDHAARSVIS